MITALTVTLESSELEADNLTADEAKENGVVSVPDTEYDEAEEKVDEGGTNPCGGPMSFVRLT